VQLDLEPEAVGVLREAVGILAQRRSLAPRRAEAEFAVDQLHGGFRVIE
jgi:hypothetical protein